MFVRGFVGSSLHLFITWMKILYSNLTLKYRMVASKCISHFLQFILLLLELFLAMIFDMSAGSVSTLSTAKSRPAQISLISIFRSWTFCGGGG